jgi:flagellar basal-body rod protein FlgG
VRTRPAATRAPATLQMGNGAAPIATVRNFTQGGLVETGNALDIAINGDGFLQVLRADGSVAYTRDGTLTVSADGSLITQTGLMIEPDINIPPEAVEKSHQSGRTRFGAHAGRA